MAVRPGPRPCHAASTAVTGLAALSKSYFEKSYPPFRSQAGHSEVPHTALVKKEDGHR